MKKWVESVWGGGECVWRGEGVLGVRETSRHNAPPSPSTSQHTYGEGLTASSGSGGDPVMANIARLSVEAMKWVRGGT